MTTQNVLKSLRSRGAATVLVGIVALSCLAIWWASSPKALATEGELTAAYYANATLSGTPVLVRSESTINFKHTSAQSPAPGIAPTQYSVRWTGKVKAPEDGVYKITTDSDDGIRVWIDDQLIVNSWTSHALMQNSGSIFMDAQKAYSLRVEYYQGLAGAKAALSWHGPGTDGLTLIPSSAYSTTASAGSPVGKPLHVYNGGISPEELAKRPTAITGQPTANWIGGWTGNGDPAAAVDAIATDAATKGMLATFVLYNIPSRDCGGYSAGGAGSVDAYKAWVRQFATGLGKREAIVIVEPDSLAQLDCLNDTDKARRLENISDAVNVLAADTGAIIYLDAGNPTWINASEMAARLANANVAKARGFALNVSNFSRTVDNVYYGTQVAAKIGSKPFVIDTSRNGQGPAENNEWCNPAGRGLGAKPNTATGDVLVDAYLWIKRPGESDGTCSGGPAAGQWWQAYAEGLVSRANY